MRIVAGAADLTCKVNFYADGPVGGRFAFKVSRIEDNTPDDTDYETMFIFFIENNIEFKAHTFEFPLEAGYLYRVDRDDTHDTALADPEILLIVKEYPPQEVKHV